MSGYVKESCRFVSNVRNRVIIMLYFGQAKRALGLEKKSRWRGFKQSIFVALVAMLAQPVHSIRADQLTPRRGMYEITVRLEVPHVERWAVDQTTTICLPTTKSSGEIPVPVLSANNPFAKCAATNLTTNGATLQYDIICPGRGAAKAHAIYTLAADTFAGRVMMVMGGKNMTMTELQRGRRRGDCGPLELESDQTSPYSRKTPL